MALIGGRQALLGPSQSLSHSFSRSTHHSYLQVPRCHIARRTVSTQAQSVNEQAVEHDLEGMNRASVEDIHGQVTVQFRGIKLQVQKGIKLRTALLKSGFQGVTPHTGDARLINCRGLGTCGTCAVQISGPVEPMSWTIMESARLNFIPHGPPGNQRLRLACQVRCQGDLQVTKYSGFWGQGQDPLPDLPSVGPGCDSSDDSDKAGVLGVGRTPLGALEYILDRDAKTSGRGHFK